MLVHFAKSAWWRVGGQGKLHGALDTCRFSVSADGSCQHVEAVQGNHQHRQTRKYRISHHSSSMHAQSPTLHQLDAAAVCACQHRARQHTNDRQQNSGSTQHHGQGPRGAAEKQVARPRWLLGQHNTSLRTTATPTKAASPTASGRLLEVELHAQAVSCVLNSEAHINNLRQQAAARGAKTLTVLSCQCKPTIAVG